MNKRSKIAMLALLAAVPTAYAQTISYDWTETGSSFGDASGTLTLDSTPLGPDSSVSYYGGSGYDYQLTALTGSFTSGTLSGSAVSLVSSPYDTLNLAGNTPSTSLLGAITYFDAGANEYLLLGGSKFSPGNPYQISERFGSYNSDQSDDTFTLSAYTPVAPVPESPLNPSLVAVAGLFIGWRSWRTLRTV